MFIGDVLAAETRTAMVRYVFQNSIARMICVIISSGTALNTDFRSVRQHFALCYCNCNDWNCPGYGCYHFMVKVTIIDDDDASCTRKNGPSGMTSKVF
mmetsp:Transcript_50649/g.158249  ORF Transcript_50649/g.158249 Transcript_50649/m.158249 type:complete len:98 (+) Transcript_50649:1330-1623(+)